MTQLYHIPSDASLEAVRRQLALLQSDRVVVVVPPDWTELDNLARMHILQRQAQTLGREIAVVTRHGATRKAAKLAGIPVFATVQRAGRAHWRMQPATARIDSRRKGYNLPEAPAGSRRSIAGLLTRPHLRRARQRRIEIEQQVRRPVSFWVRWAGTLAMAAVLTLVLLTVALYVLPAATITLVPATFILIAS